MAENLIPPVMFLMVAIASVTDLRSYRVPNWLTFPVLLFALSTHSLADGGSGFIFSAGGLLVGFSVLLPFYALGGMGAGDVKLLAAVGACVGAKLTAIIFLITALLGGVYAIGLWAVVAVSSQGLREALRSASVGLKTALLTGQVSSAPQESGSSPKLCYAVCIAAATVIVHVVDGRLLLGRFGT